ncbi:hypothetical protein E2C01_035396 [Portunus trituberculatus]|uniref:Uncharacterized protein n=1 Tax=Portunus trituberculatus TaxID=210409 RepID=A0A5B7F333_PORTR|nr:hypothetical protein [Portunus trituberculatus]
MSPSRGGAGEIHDHRKNTNGTKASNSRYCSSRLKMNGGKRVGFKQEFKRSNAKLSGIPAPYKMMLIGGR